MTSLEEDELEEEELEEEDVMACGGSHRGRQSRGAGQVKGWTETDGVAMQGRKGEETTEGRGAGR
jgi:hypothetical protein